MKPKARRGHPPITCRPPPELRAFMRTMSKSYGMNEAALIYDLIRSAMGKRSRRPSKRDVDLQEGMANIHALLIAIGNQACPSAGDNKMSIVEGLADVVTAVSRLEDAVRGE